MSEQKKQSNRKRFSSEEKFKIVKEHLTTKTAISELCRKHGLTSASFYAWQEQFFTAALAGFDRKRGPQAQVATNNKRADELEADNVRMRDVIAEISAENVAYKKKNSAYLR